MFFFSIVVVVVYLSRLKVSCKSKTNETIGNLREREICSEPLTFQFYLLFQSNFRILRFYIPISKKASSIILFEIKYLGICMKDKGNKQ